MLPEVEFRTACLLLTCIIAAGSHALDRWLLAMKIKGALPRHQLQQRTEGTSST